MTKADAKEPAILTRLVLAMMARRTDSRFRFAVTEAEFWEIRNYALATEGRFFARIRDIPLVVEDQPDDRPLTVEFRRNETVT